MAISFNSARLPPKPKKEPYIPEEDKAQELVYLYARCQLHHGRGKKILFRQYHPAPLKPVLEEVEETEEIGNTDLQPQLHFPFNKWGMRIWMLCGISFWIIVIYFLIKSMP